MREVFCCPKIVKNLTISLTQETSRNDTHGTVDTFTHAGARTTKRGQAERQGTGRASQRASEREQHTTQHNDEYIVNVLTMYSIVVWYGRVWGRGVPGVGAGQADSPTVRWENALPTGRVHREPRTLFLL